MSPPFVFVDPQKDHLGRGSFNFTVISFLGHFQAIFACPSNTSQKNSALGAEGLFSGGGVI